MLTINQTFWDFVRDNISADPSKLRLKYHGRTSQDIDISLAITQIECRRKFGKKLAQTLSANPQWLFPSVLSGEQSTSDRLADYHTTLIKDGETVADLTAGLGIDAWHIRTVASCVTAVEIDEHKADALRYNLSSKGINVVNDDCQTYITQCSDDAFDTIFIDPARRADDGKRIFALDQCQPNVIAMLPQLSKTAKRLIVKMSPMLDITQTLRDLPNTERIIAMGTETECKELIAVVDMRRTREEAVIEAVTVRGNDTGKMHKPSVITFTQAEERDNKDTASTIMPQQGYYLYDPYPAVMKAAPFNILQHRYGVRALHPNTHLYISETMVDDFPGQCMQIERVIPYNSKYIKRIHKEYPKLNVSVRNFDMSADRLKDKLGVTDGGPRRLIGATLADGSKAMLMVVPVCDELKSQSPATENN